MDWRFKKRMRENNLERFIKAQESEFKTALAEIKSGHKIGRASCRERV